jgi:hypothetical protein
MENHYIVLEYAGAHEMTEQPMAGRAFGAVAAALPAVDCS